MQIYHNPRCSKSRTALEQAQSFTAKNGEQLEVIEYLTTPPTLADLKKLAAQLDTPLQAVAHTVKHPAATQGEAWYRHGSLTASYFHAYFPSNPAATATLFTRSAT